MTTDKTLSAKASPEQIIYANILLIGVWTSIFLLFATYMIYLTGILDNHVEISLVISNWGKSVNEYLEITHSPHGWNWVSLLTKGDFLNYLGFAFLGLLTVFCFIILLRGYIRRNNYIYAIISFLEIVVLSLAASGIFGSGGH